MDADRMDEIVKEDFLRYGVDYESIWWPYLRQFHFYTRDDYTGEKEPFWWKFRTTNWLVRCWHSVYDYVRLDICKDWLFDCSPYGNWSRSITPSFPPCHQGCSKQHCCISDPMVQSLRQVHKCCSSTATIASSWTT